MSFERLQSLIDEKENPTVLGLDPDLNHIPPQILEQNIKEHGETLEAASISVLRFNMLLIDALCDIVPAIKPQAAYYERLGSAGIVALQLTCAHAKQKGLYVIIDAKRNDIGPTAEAYSETYLGSVCVGNTELTPFDADALTVNAYLGSDGIAPFFETCKKNDKAIFALVRTSNPSAGEIQDLIVGKNKLYSTVGDLVESIGGEEVDKHGYTRVGAVVGATYPDEMIFLRNRLKKTFFLVPGYGAQGGGAKDVVGAFDENKKGAIINSSRAIIAAWKKHCDDESIVSEQEFVDAARSEAIRMKEELCRAIYT